MIDEAVWWDESGLFSVNWWRFLRNPRNARHDIPHEEHTPGLRLNGDKAGHLPIISRRPLAGTSNTLTLKALRF